MPVIFNKIYILFDVDLFFMTSIHHILHSMFPPIELPIFFSDSVRQTEDREFQFQINILIKNMLIAIHVLYHITLY
jgi:hypothetical protein